MNRLAKKSLTASVLLTMILSLMPAIRAKAEGYIVQAVDSTIPSSNENGQGSIRDAMFQVNAEGGLPAFCLNFTYKAPPEAGQDKYTRYTVKRDDINTYVGSSYRRASGEDLYKRLMTILYYGYNGGGKDQTIAGLLTQQSDYKNDLFRIATQYAIWYYTDGNNQTFGEEAGTPETFKTYMRRRTGLGESDLNLASQIYGRLISLDLSLPQDFNEQSKELVIYNGTAVDQLGSVKPGTRWQNMITSRSIKDRKSKNFEFSKTDVNGTAELKGATLQIQDNSGKKIYEWVSDGNTKSVQLYEGKYKMVEITEPNGYEKADDISFEVVEGNNGELKIKDKDTGRVVMQDKPIPEITISKRELGTKNLVGGAQLTITETAYYPNGEEKDRVERKDSGVKFVVDTLTDKDRVVNLYYGEYILSETTAPTGYKPAQPILFKVMKPSEGTWKVLVKKGNDFVDPEEKAATVIMYDEKDNPKTPPKPNTPPNPNTPPDKPNTPPNPNTPPTPPNTPQNPNNGHSAPQVAGAKRSNPGTPGTPGTPVPPSDGGHVPGVAGAQRSPETADATPIVLLLGIMSFAAVGLGIFMHKWKKLG